MKIWIKAAAVGAALALAACGGNDRAENVEEAAENRAETLEDMADNATNEAAEEALENRAEAVEEAGEEKAEAIEESDGASTHEESNVSGM